MPKRSKDTAQAKDATQDEATPPKEEGALRYPLQSAETKNKPLAKKVKTAGPAPAKWFIKSFPIRDVDGFSGFGHYHSPLWVRAQAKNKKGDQVLIADPLENLDKRTDWLDAFFSQSRYNAKYGTSAHMNDEQRIECMKQIALDAVKTFAKIAKKQPKVEDRHEYAHQFQSNRFDYEPNADNYTSWLYGVVVRSMLSSDHCSR